MKDADGMPDNLVHIPNLQDQQEVLAFLKKWLTSGSEDLLQKLYRMDVSEKKLEEAFSNANPDIDKLAILVYERLCEKIKTRKSYPKDHNIDPELLW